MAAKEGKGSMGYAGLQRGDSTLSTVRTAKRLSSVGLCERPLPLPLRLAACDTTASAGGSKNTLRHAGAVV